MRVNYQTITVANIKMDDERDGDFSIIFNKEFTKEECIKFAEIEMKRNRRPVGSYRVIISYSTLITK